MKLVEKLGMQYPDKGGKNKYRYALYECPLCLITFKTQVASVKSGRSNKCRSCQVAEKNKTHGMSSDPMYRRYSCMMRRCYDKSSSSFKNYGGRGVTVEDYLQTVENYVEYVKSLEGTSVKGGTIDRINNNGNYERGNLRWVNMTYQNTNQRKKKTSKFKYIGVYRLDMPTEQYGFRIRVEGERVYKSGFKSQEDAARARDSYIISNNLQHVLTGVSE